MKHSVIFHPDAQTEYTDASLWYEEKQVGLGLKFEEAIENKLQQIIDDPFVYPIKKGLYRQAIVQDFPFLIVYKIQAFQKAIYISSVFHMSRNPQKKYRKF